MARFALSVILSCTIATAVTAQDAIPETPPELRDFRLDPQPPATQPQPEPQPRTETATPPPVAPTITEPRTAPARSQRQPQPRTVEPPSPTASTPDNSGTEPVSAAPEVIEETPDALPTESPPVPLPEAAPASLSMWQIAAGFALLVMALLAGFWFKRRRAAATEMQQEPEIAPRTEPFKTPEPARPIVAATPVKPAKKADIILDFIPEKATVSFTTLTVKGQLRLINEGSALAKDMQLRVGLVSASARQDEFIEAFHSTSAQVKAEPLGDAKPGERIGMAIELSVPLTDMESFVVGDQKLLVPIVVANLAYGNGSTSHQQTARIACMIGREATPPAPKMGPLRLDLGPRSFAHLGQRPLAV